MLRKRFPLLVPTLVFVLALSFASAPAAGAAADGAIIYAGSSGSQDLTWEQDADGAFVPRLPGARPLAETDKPVLVSQVLNLLVPLDSPVAGIEVIPVASHREPLPGPLQLGGQIFTHDEVGVTVDRLALGESAYPEQWGEFGGSHVWRGFRLVAVQVYPLRLLRGPDGEWTEVEVLDQYQIRLITDDSAPLPDVAHRQRLVPGERQRAEASLRSLVANPEALIGYDRPDGEVVPEPVGGFQPARTPTLSGSAVSYLIVTNEELAPAFQVLADFKTAQGNPAVVSTVEWIEANFRNGADIQETIRMFIREAYENWGVEWVLLGGDSDVLPCRYVTSTYYPAGGSTEIPVDLYFYCLDGNWNADGDNYFCEPYTHYLYPGDDADLADDVYGGRAPVSSLEAATVFVNKVITYAETATDNPWTNRDLFLAEVLFPQAWEPGETVSLDGAAYAEQIVNNFVIPCTSREYARMYENYYDYPGSVPLTRDAAIDSMNSGHYGIVDHIGHGFFFNMSMGNTNLMSAHVDALVNGDHLFLLYGLNCASCAFDYACIMERFMQNPNGGSMASIGATRAAFPHTANEYQQEFFDHLYCQEARHLGEMRSLSRFPFLPSTFYNTVDRWTFMNYTLLGDPNLAVWTAEIAAAQITAPGALTAGEQVVSITVNSGGAPVDSALVCLAKDGDDYAHGFTDAAGNLNLSFTPTSAGSAVLTVTGTDLERTEQTIPVTTGATYIQVADVNLFDDGTDSSVGNANGAPESGETVALYLVCQDTGGGGATGCTAALTTSTVGVTILDGSATVGDVPPGGQKTADDSFLILIDPSVGDGALLDLDVVVTDGGSGTYEDEWTLTALAPELEPVELVWTDAAPFGNGNQTQEDGEEVGVFITLKNFGVGVADTVTGYLRTADPQVTLINTIATYHGLGLLDSSVGTDSVFSFSDADVVTDSWCWVLFEDNYGRTFRHDFHLDAPSAPDGLETDTSCGPDIIALHWLPVLDPGTRGYHVYRSGSAVGPFARVNVDLVDRVSYYRNDDLDLLTRYYYRITAVDSSLVEGPPSLTISASTAPPENPGFPLPFSVETSGHCVVGDVNGDGMSDIVLGADEIYVWGADGSELFDGDNDSQTHGPITDLNAAFGPAGLLLAPLDDEPGCEIIASESGLHQIHIFRHDGTELPGWPKDLRSNTNGWNWATPAVGDVDGDGDPEIVVNTLDARTWVWHVDGTELMDGDSDPATDGVFLFRSDYPYEWGMSSPALYDLDDDGAKDIIFGSKYGAGNYNKLHAFRYDQSEVPGFPDSTAQGNILCSPTVADLNVDGIWEIIYQSQDNYLHVVQEDGSAYSGFPIPFPSNTTFCPSPAVGDFDSDDELEILAISTESINLANLYVIDTDIGGGTSGETLTGWPQAVPGNSEASPVVGDIDGDGVPDALHGIGGGSEDSPNNLYAFKADGTLVDGFPITVGGPLRTSPIIFDLDHDSDVDIIYGGWDLLIHVWDMPFTYDATNVPWPTFRGHQYRDGVHRTPDLVPVPNQMLPTDLFLAAPYPNPFNPATTVKLYVPGDLGGSSSVRVGIYNLQGRLVQTIHDGPLAVGWHSWVWNGRDQAGRGQASGLYFLRAHGEQGSVVHKMSLIK